MSSEKTVFESWMDGIGTDPNGFLSSMAKATPKSKNHRRGGAAVMQSGGIIDTTNFDKEKKNVMKKKNSKSDLPF